ncbi:MAG TPA: hypothetical protein VGW78_05955 [Candidatus Babeliales bacterium]|jgi:hypothetical protein|nr:hypothetical protein [Candidatus Babeliales bacterium]
MFLNRYFYIAIVISTFTLHAMEMGKDNYYNIRTMPLDIQLPIYNQLKNEDLQNLSLTCTDMHNTIKPFLQTRKKNIRLNQITLLQLLEKHYRTIPHLRHLQFSNAIKDLKKDEHYQTLLPFRNDIVNIAWRCDQNNTACTFVAHTPSSFTLFYALLNKNLTFESKLANLHNTQMVYMPYFDTNNNASVIDVYKNFANNKNMSKAVSLSPDKESKEIWRTINIHDANTSYSLAHMKKYPILLAQCGIAAHTDVLTHETPENTLTCLINDIHIPGLFTPYKEKLTHIFAFPKIMMPNYNCNKETILDWAHFYYACGNIKPTTDCFSHYQHILFTEARKQNPCMSYDSIINNGDLQSLFNTCVHNHSYKPYEKFLNASYGLICNKNNKNIILSIHHNPDNNYKTMDIRSMPLKFFGPNPRLYETLSVSFDNTYTIIDADTFIQSLTNIKAKAALILKNHKNNQEQVTLHIIKLPSNAAFPKDSEYKKTYGIPSEYTATAIDFFGKNELHVTLQPKKEPTKISTLIIDTKLNRKKIIDKKLKNKKYV